MDARKIPGKWEAVGMMLTLSSSDFLLGYKNMGTIPQFRVGLKSWEWAFTWFYIRESQTVDTRREEESRIWGNSRTSGKEEGQGYIKIVAQAPDSAVLPDLLLYAMAGSVSG